MSPKQANVAEQVIFKYSSNTVTAIAVAFVLMQEIFISDT